MIKTLATVGGAAVAGLGAYELAKHVSPTKAAYGVAAVGAAAAIGAAAVKRAPGWLQGLSNGVAAAGVTLAAIDLLQKPAATEASKKQLPAAQQQPQAQQPQAQQPQAQQPQQQHAPPPGPPPRPGATGAQARNEGYVTKDELDAAVRRAFADHHEALAQSLRQEVRNAVGAIATMAGAPARPDAEGTMSGLAEEQRNAGYYEEREAWHEAEARNADGDDREAWHDVRNYGEEEYEPRNADDREAWHDA